MGIVEKWMVDGRNRPLWAGRNPSNCLVSEGRLLYNRGAPKFGKYTNERRS